VGIEGNFIPKYAAIADFAKKPIRYISRAAGSLEPALSSICPCKISIYGLETNLKLKYAMTIIAINSTTPDKYPILAYHKSISGCLFINR
jgi:hypothetical protein